MSIHLGMSIDPTQQYTQQQQQKTAHIFYDHITKNRTEQF